MITDQQYPTTKQAMTIRTYLDAVTDFRHNLPKVIARIDDLYFSYRLETWHTVPEEYKTANGWEFVEIISDPAEWLGERVPTYTGNDYGDRNGRGGEVATARLVCAKLVQKGIIPPEIVDVVVYRVSTGHI